MLSKGDGHSAKAAPPCGLAHGWGFLFGRADFSSPASGELAPRPCSAGPVALSKGLDEGRVDERVAV